MTEAESVHATAFLCHSSGDVEQVRDLYHRLSRDGVSCWLDVENLVPGQDWDYEIRKAMRDCRYVLACLSKSSVPKRGYVQKELTRALDLADEQPEGSIFLIPVRLEPCEVPSRLGRLERVDLFDPNGYERLLRGLRYDQSLAASPLPEAALDTPTRFPDRLNELLAAAKQVPWWARRPDRVDLLPLATTLHPDERITGCASLVFSLLTSGAIVVTDQNVHLSTSDPNGQYWSRTWGQLPEQYRVAEDRARIPLQDIEGLAEIVDGHPVLPIRGRGPIALTDYAAEPTARLFQRYLAQAQEQARTRAGSVEQGSAQDPGQRVLEKVHRQVQKASSWYAVWDFQRLGWNRGNHIVKVHLDTDHTILLSMTRSRDALMVDGMEVAHSYVGLGGVHNFAILDGGIEKRARLGVSLRLSRTMAAIYRFTSLTVDGRSVEIVEGATVPT